MWHKSKMLSTMILGIICISLITPYVSMAEITVIQNNAVAKEKLSKIDDEEKGIVEELFLLSSELELIETQMLKLNEHIVSLQTSINEKSIEIDQAIVHYELLKQNLSKVLKSQQRSGIASNIEIVLNSKNLKDLIRRLNLLRDLSRNTSQLMAEIESTKVNLEAEQKKMDTLLSELENNKVELQTTYESKNIAKTDLESYLNSLQSQKSYYEEYLQSIETLWLSLKPLFSKTISGFTDIIESGGLSDDMVELTVSLFNARGKIVQEKFNSLLSERKDLPELKFGFYKDKITLSFPSYEIELEGNFVLVDEKTIQYEVTGGSFYKLPLSKSALMDLFSEGDLVFSLKSLLGKNNIKRIDNYDGYIILLITVSLF